MSDGATAADADLRHAPKFDGFFSHFMRFQGIKMASVHSEAAAFASNEARLGFC